MAHYPPHYLHQHWGSSFSSPTSSPSPSTSPSPSPSPSPFAYPSFGRQHAGSYFRASAEDLSLAIADLSLHGQPTYNVSPSPGAGSQKSALVEKRYGAGPGHGPKVRWPDHPAEDHAHQKARGEPPPFKTSKSLPSSRRNSFSKEGPFYRGGPPLEDFDSYEPSHPHQAGPYPGDRSYARLFQHPPLMDTIPSSLAPPQFSDHFLYDDDELVGSSAAPSHVSSYLQRFSSDTNHFPVLLRRDSIPGVLSASSASMDPNFRPAFQMGGSLNRDDLMPGFGHPSALMQPGSPPPEGDDGPEVRGGLGICKYYLQGFCSRGDRCKFSHVPAASASYDHLPLAHSHPHSPSPSPPPPFDVHPSSALHDKKGLGSYHHLPEGSPYPSFRPSFTPDISAPKQQQQQQQQPLTATATAGTAASSSAAAAAAKKGHKRSTSAPETPRFPPLEQLTGQIYSLCRDQHGCRYLQKKLEEGKEEYVEIIAREINDHLLELMSDPFGNYLCQKLFQSANEEQRGRIARHVGEGLVDVSLNMHGTRSVQKLIDCVANESDSQIPLITQPLRGHVVRLIKDLNGNHVIQKCLNKLTPAQNQFIYDAVTEHCVEVASHRHGCCVLQRCIDHASPAQKAQLAREITRHALPLVQDAFGNYVVQYILDLNVPEYSNPLISCFVDQVFPLSLQKFSSNVIEKCIRVASPEIRRGLVAGIMDKDKIFHMLQDAFANYVIQTSLDVADPDQHHMLAELVRPLLPGIRHLPYCKRVQSKLNRDHLGGKPHPMVPFIPFPHPLHGHP